MNLYLSTYTSPLLTKHSKLIRHETGEKATQAHIDYLLGIGIAAHHLLTIETTLLVNDGPIGIIGIIKL